MSNKASFESRVMDFFTNASFERVDITYGLVREIFKRRKVAQAEEAGRVATIAGHPAPRKKRRTRAQIAAAAVNKSDGVSTPPPTAASA